MWERFGDVPNYVEPFFGSGAVLFGRPTSPGTETVNDLDGYIANFWRASVADPEQVARYADWPVNENDLHARHSWLLQQRDELQARLEGDPDFCDPKIAGWWCWGLCCWIGSGWCSGKGPWQSVDGMMTNVGSGKQGVNRQLPHLGNAGQGVNRKLPHLGGAGQGVNRKLPHLGGAGQGVNRKRSNLLGLFTEIQDRLRDVRVCCGDWERVCGPSVTFKHGVTGVFLDPPYSHDERDDRIYRVEMAVADRVRDWCVANSDNPLLRIALCGYEGEHEMPRDWECIPWKAKGGFGSQGDGIGRANAHRERIWFSPACINPELALFDDARHKGATE